MSRSVSRSILLAGISAVGVTVSFDSPARAGEITGRVTNPGTFLWQAEVEIIDHTDEGVMETLVFSDDFLGDVYSEFWEVTVEYGDHEFFDFDDDDIRVFAFHSDPNGPHFGEGDGPVLEAFLFDIDDGVNRGPASDTGQHFGHLDTLTISYQEGGLVDPDRVFIQLTHPVPEPATLLLFALGSLCAIRRGREHQTILALGGCGGT